MSSKELILEPDEEICENCKGTGETEITIREGEEGMKIEKDVPWICGECDGTGEIKKDDI